MSEEISSCSSLSSTHRYDIFLSFRGPDTRQTITAHLYERLTRVGFNVYKNEIEMEKGENINDDLKKAKSSSRVCIPIFSKDYASSKACLRELSHMLDCKKKIIAIFYNVTPDDVKLKTEVYQDALLKYRGDEGLRDEIPKWEKALKSVAEMSGYDFANKNEVDEITSITHYLIKLMPKDQDLTSLFVDVNEQVEQVKTLLCLNSDGCCIIVIHGLGGIGKTTLARVIFNKLHSSFRNGSFLENVRECLESKKHVELQRQLYKDMIDPKLDGHITDRNDGIIKLEHGLRNKEILLVLDDMNDVEQLEELLGNEVSFARGSKIIITTRDKGILNGLKKYGMVLEYKVEEMKSHQALKLFCRSAFQGDNPHIGYESLSEKAISYTGGLPLALKVIGSVLGCIEKEAWEKTLDQLRTCPEDKIKRAMMISYQALNEHQKAIFLDIASYPGDMYETFACYMWEDCEWNPKRSITDLINRSLISVVYKDLRLEDLEGEHLRMHDVLKDFGRNIVREERKNFQRPPGRLHIIGILDDLHGIEGKENVETLVIDAPDITITRRDMVGLGKLRFLELRVYKVKGDFSGLFPNLRWLQFGGFVKFEPTNFNPKNLVVFHLPWHAHAKRWKDWRRMKVDKLKALRLCNSGGIPYLRSLLPANFKCILNATNLEKLTLSTGYTITGIEEMGNFLQLRELILERVKFNYKLHLPSSLLRLKILFCEFVNENLDVSNLKNLIYFESASYVKPCQIKGLEKLYSLEVQFLRGVHNINSSRPHGPSIMDNTTEGDLKNLKESCINCNPLQKMSGPSKMKGSFLMDFNGLESLIRLEIRRGYFEILPNLSKLRKLRYLTLLWCEELSCIQGIPQLEFLEGVMIADCDSLELSPPDFKKLENVSSVFIEGCKKLPRITKGSSFPYFNAYRLTFESLPPRTENPMDGRAQGRTLAAEIELKVRLHFESNLHGCQDTIVQISFSPSVNPHSHGRQSLSRFSVDIEIHRSA